MANRLRLNIEPPAEGWVMVRLTAADVELEFPASYTPRDSIGDLARAAIGLADGVLEQVVIWYTEPAEYEFRFLPAGARTRLEVWEFPDWRRMRGRFGEVVAVIDGEVVAIARSLWRGLMRLRGAVPAEEFVAAWRHPFPFASVEQLGERLGVVHKR